MFTATFCEIRTRPEGGLVTLPEAWGALTMPPEAPRALSKSKDRVVYNYELPAPVRVPPKAACDLAFLGKTVLACEYGGAAGIPTYRPGADFGALPDEKWVQLNPIADDFVIQLKLRKMEPAGPGWGPGDPGTGELYVYGASRFVVQVTLPRATAEAAALAPAPVSDADRAMLI